MLFDWYKYMMGLWTNDENESRQRLIKQYINEVENKVMVKNHNDLYIYKNYISLFPSFIYLTPSHLKDKFPWGLLLQLALASFSSIVHVKYNPIRKLPELLITVNYSYYVSKQISNLNKLQVDSLFDIYFREQIELEMIMRHDAQRRDEIIIQRKHNLIAAQRIQLMVNKYKFLYI